MTAPFLIDRHFGELINPVFKKAQGHGTDDFAVDRCEKYPAAILQDRFIRMFKHPFIQRFHRKIFLEPGFVKVLEIGLVLWLVIDQFKTHRLIISVQYKIMKYNYDKTDAVLLILTITDFK